MLLNRYLSIKIDVDRATLWHSLIALFSCVVHSVVNSSILSSGLSFVWLRFWFFFLLNCLREAGQYRPFTSKFSTYFSRAPIFCRSVGLITSMWNDGCSTHRDIVVKSGSEKNVFKTINSICLVHTSSFGNAPSLIRLSLSSAKKKKFVFKFLI